MPKNGLTLIVSSWFRLTRLCSWSLVETFAITLKEVRKPVVLCLLLALCVYVSLEIYLWLIIAHASPGATLPITTNTSISSCYASPYCVITTKSLLYSPMDFYVHKPLSILINEVFQVGLLLSADFVSASHIVVAIISAKFVSNDSLSARRFGVLLFQVRHILDCLDGVLAKEEHKSRGHLHLLNQPTFIGYYVDGVSDGLGCGFLLLACLIYMQRHPFQRKVLRKIYSPLLSVVSLNSTGAPMCNGTKCLKKKPKEDIEDSDDESVNSNPQAYSSPCAKLRKCLSACHITGAGIPAVLYLTQLFYSSVLWNRNIYLYAKILEPASQTLYYTETVGRYRQIEASNLLHSSLMWVVIFGWRICNPLNFTDLLLLAIFHDIMHEFLISAQYLGFFLISSIVVISEVHRFNTSAGSSVINPM